MPVVVGQDKSLAKLMTCKHCGAINEYMPNEVRIVYKGMDISGCTEVDRGFNCGQCGEKVIVSSS